MHAAVISGCNESAETVTVEWFENNETKGKEIDIRVVASINNLKEHAAGAATPDDRQVAQRRLAQNQPQGALNPASQAKPSSLVWGGGDGGF